MYFTETKRKKVCYIHMKFCHNIVHYLIFLYYTFKILKSFFVSLIKKKEALIYLLIETNQVTIVTEIVASLPLISVIIVRTQFSRNDPKIGLLIFVELCFVLEK